MPVTKAVVPAAGLGTRFLPASKAVPKEMIPVVDKPAIQYVVEEAIAAGVEDVLIITARGKTTIEDHFDRAPELEARLEATGKAEALAEVRAVAALAAVHYVRQLEPKGFGHAVLMAKAHVGADPVAVMVPDEIVPPPATGEIALLQRMFEIYDREGASVIAVQEVPREAISAYGAIAPSGAARGDVVPFSSMIEKPPVDSAPSTLASRGRYVFTPEIFEALETTPPGVGGEIQLTDAIRTLAERGRAVAYVHPGPILDVGKKLDYLRATVTLALRRPDLSPAFRAFLEEVARA